MPLIELMRKAWGVAKTEGLPETVRHTRNWLSEKYHERRLGVDTEGFIVLHSLGIDSIADYDPTDYRSLIVALNRVAINSERDAFLDFGCGKGRVVVIAATYPFKRVIGIDFVPEMVAAAEENIRRAAKKLRCKEVVLYTQDIAAFSVPKDVTVTFVNVGADLLPTVIHKLHESLEATPRKVTIFFKKQQWVENLFETCGWVRVRGEVPCYSPARERFLVYETVMRQ
jgi:SAM-dependent methyltransferase